MKKKKTNKIIITLITLLAILVPFYPQVKANNIYKVAEVIPASYTDIVEFYGNIFRIDNGYTALCLEREKATPQVGTELSLSYLEDPYIKKILYYGYGGPAQWNGFSSSGEAILCTSIMLSQAYSGTGYRNICDNFKNYLASVPNLPIYSLNFSPSQCYAYGEGDRQRTELITLEGDKRLSTNITLDENMTIHFTNGETKSGTVTLYGGDSFYISVPKNTQGKWESGDLYLNEKAYNVALLTSSSQDIQDLTYLVTFPNQKCDTLSITWYNKGSLEIIKSSSMDSISLNNPNYSLSNAQYNLYFSLEDATQNKNPVISLYTDETGYAKADHLTSGSYFLKEISPPMGFELSEEIIPVDINTLTVTRITTTDTPSTKPFELIKYGEKIEENSPLQGAGFMVCPTKDLDKDSDGNYIWDYDKVIPITHSGDMELFTNEEGYALSTPLPFGTYLVKETTVPLNYLPVDDFLVTISNDSSTNQNMIYLTDRSFKAYIQITKQDSSTNKIILNNPATFKIWSVNEEKYISYELIDGDKTLSIDQFQTDSNGTLITPEPLMPGKYIIEEICAPSGYLPASSTSAYVIDISNDKDYTQYVDENGNYTDLGIFTVCIENSPITGQIQINKSLEIPPDSVYTPSLLGIKFNIYAKDTIYSPDGTNTIIYNQGELIETVTTNPDGVAFSSPNLPLGKYEIEEVNPPSGYVKSENIIVDLTNDKPTDQVIYTLETSGIILAEVKIHNKQIEPVVLGETYTKNPEVPSIDTPKTGDTLIVFVLLTLLISIISTTIFFKKSKKQI